MTTAIANEPEVTAAPAARNSVITWFEILAADFERAVDPVRRAGDLPIRIAALQVQRRQHELFGCFRLGGREDGFERLVTDHVVAFRERGGAACEFMRFGDHREHWLAEIQHLIDGENRVVVQYRAAIVFTGDVVGGQHGDHTWGISDRVQID